MFLKSVFFIFVIIFAFVSAAPKKCGENEEFTKCGTMCEAKCAEPAPMFCIESCKVDVCQCKPKFYRNQKGACVTWKKC